jgi:hypothetical protein
MNRKQIICLWIGIIIIVLMGIFPPWSAYKGDGECYLLHKFILFQPAEKNIPARIDTGHLFVQWIMVAVVTGGLIFTFRDKKEKKLKEEQKE